MENKNILDTRSLKQQVYDYLREQIRGQKIRPGSVINMDATSRKLGISKTPLRDALLQLEMEGFVTVAPRKGIYVNSLSSKEIKEFYQVIGALEASVISDCFTLIKPIHIEKMAQLNQQMGKALEQNNFDRFYRDNLAFHNTYIHLTENQTLIKILDHLKRRLYDFIPQDQWIKEWEINSLGEHQQLVEAFKEKKLERAIFIIRDIHWSFQVHEKYIHMYYSVENNSPR